MNSGSFGGKSYSPMSGARISYGILGDKKLSNSVAQSNKPKNSSINSMDMNLRQKPTVVEQIMRKSNNTPSLKRKGVMNNLNMLETQFANFNKKQKVDPITQVMKTSDDFLLEL